MAIKCYHCKGIHVSVSDVKACSTNPVNINVKAGAPKGAEAVSAFLATPDNSWADKVAKVAAAQATAAAAKVTVPAHRTSAKYLALKAQVAPKNAGDQFLADVAKLQQVADANPGISIEAGIAKAASLPEIKKGQDLECGMYQVTSESGEVIIFKVKWNKSNTYKYAERLWISTSAKWDIDSNSWIDMPKGKFIYANSMMKTLTSEHKMTEEMAKAFHDATKAKYGVDYGFCCVCGKLLTVKKSIDAGIGPKCATYFA